MNRSKVCTYIQVGKTFIFKGQWEKVPALAQLIQQTIDPWWRIGVQLCDSIQVPVVNPKVMGSILFANHDDRTCPTACRWLNHMWFFRRHFKPLSLRELGFSIYSGRIDVHVLTQPMIVCCKMPLRVHLNLPSSSFLLSPPLFSSPLSSSPSSPFLLSPPLPPPLSSSPPLPPFLSFYV